jgi:ribosome-associated toxin RatA of RatAB toxin-antitoxin module
VTARLHLAYAGVRHAFTTRNRNEAGERVRMELVDGPFSQLDGPGNSCR